MECSKNTLKIKVAFVAMNGSVVDIGDESNPALTRSHSIFYELKKSQAIEAIAIYPNRKILKKGYLTTIFNQTFNLFSSVRLLLLILKERPVVFFTYPWMMNVQNRFMLRIADFFGCTIILDLQDTVDQDEVIGVKNHKLSDYKLENEIISRSNLIIALNERMWTSLLLSHKLSVRGKIIFIGSGFDNSFINECSQPYKSVGGRFNICYLGNYSINRGIEQLIVACREVYQTVPELQLHLLMPEENRLPEGLILNDDSFIILSNTPSSGIPHILKNMDLLALLYNPNIEYLNESSPTKLFEYIGSGRPIISSKLSSIEDLLPDDAVFFTDYDPDSIRTTIFNAYRDTEKREMMAEKIRAIRDEYSWMNRGKIVAQGIVEVVTGDKF